MEKEKGLKSKLSYDGRQLMTRIPTKIQKRAKFEKGEWLDWEIQGSKIIVRKSNENTQ